MEEYLTPGTLLSVRKEYLCDLAFNIIKRHGLTTAPGMNMYMYMYMYVLIWTYL